MIPKIKLNLKGSINIFIISVLCGICGIWLGFPNNFINFPLLVLLWPLSLCYVGLYSNSLKNIAFISWFSTFAGMACAMYWLCLPVHNVGGLPWPLAFLCALAICSILACQGLIFSLCAYAGTKLPLFAYILFLSLIWYLLEYAFAVILGFPWLPLSGALVSWLPLVQSAEFFGSYALSGLWVFISLAIFFIYPAFQKRLTLKSFGLRKTFKISLVPGLIAAVVLSAIISYGYWRLFQVNIAKDKGNAFSVLMVEGNIDQNQKWLPAFQQKSLDSYINLTKDALATIEGEQDILIIWPETALPFFYEIKRDLREKVQEFVRLVNLPLLFGSPGIERKGIEEEIYNRAFLLNSEGKIAGYYDKENLVPFGEYVPNWLHFAFLEKLLQGVGVYATGQATKPLLLEKLALGILICYEGIFPWLAQKRVEQGANVLIDISNDGWFGDSPAPRQHLFLTLLRCIEQGRWLVRSTNTGISAIANERGQIILQGSQFQQEALFGQAFIAKDLTFFHLYGIWILWSAISVIIFLSIFIIRHEKTP